MYCFIFLMWLDQETVLEVDSIVERNFIVSFFLSGSYIQ